MVTKCEAGIPCSSSNSHTVSLALNKSCGICQIPRLRAVSDAKRQALDSMYARYLKSNGNEQFVTVCFFTKNVVHSGVNRLYIFFFRNCMM